MLRATTAVMVVVVVRVVGRRRLSSIGEKEKHYRMISTLTSPVSNDVTPRLVTHAVYGAGVVITPWLLLLQP